MNIFAIFILISKVYASIRNKTSEITGEYDPTGGCLDTYLRGYEDHHKQVHPHHHSINDSLDVTDQGGLYEQHLFDYNEQTSQYYPPPDCHFIDQQIPHNHYASFGHPPHNSNRQRYDGTASLYHTNLHPFYYPNPEDYDEQNPLDPFANYHHLPPNHSFYHPDQDNYNGPIFSNPPTNYYPKQVRDVEQVEMVDLTKSESQSTSTAYSQPCIDNEGALINQAFNPPNNTTLAPIEINRFKISTPRVRTSRLMIDEVVIRSRQIATDKEKQAWKGSTDKITAEVTSQRMLVFQGKVPNIPLNTVRGKVSFEKWFEDSKWGLIVTYTYYSNRFKISGLKGYNESFFGVWILEPNMEEVPPRMGKRTKLLNENVSLKSQDILFAAPTALGEDIVKDVIKKRRVSIDGLIESIKSLVRPEANDFIIFFQVRQRSKKQNKLRR